MQCDFQSPKKPFISIIMLSFNTASLLPKALEMIKRQTFFDFELIMVDNGSTDNSQIIFQQFLTSNPSISCKIVTVKENRGIAPGRWAGLDAATGDYLLFNDGDDWMDENCLEILANRALETDADRVQCLYREVRSDGVIVRERKAAKKPCNLGSCMLQGTIFKRGIVEDFHIRTPIEIVIPEDVYFTLNFMKHTQKSEIISTVAYNYYFNPFATTATANYNKDKDLFCFYQLSEIVFKVHQESNSTTFRNQIEYLLLKVYYPLIPRLFCKIHSSDNMICYNIIHNELLRKFPNYYNNPFLIPVNNGYPFKESLCCFVVHLLERLHLIKFFSMISPIYAHSKMLRL